MQSEIIGAHEHMAVTWFTRSEPSRKCSHAAHAALFPSEDISATMILFHGVLEARDLTQSRGRLMFWRSLVLACVAPLIMFPATPTAWSVFGQNAMILFVTFRRRIQISCACQCLADRMRKQRVPTDSCRSRCCRRFAKGVQGPSARYGGLTFPKRLGVVLLWARVFWDLVPVEQGMEADSQEACGPRQCHTTGVLL